MIGQLPALVLLFSLIFGLNLIPAFAPPTWMALAFVGFEFPETNTVLLALVGAAAATLGRITLAKLSHWLLREKLLSEAHRKNIDVIKERLEKRTALTVGLFLFYAFSPLPSKRWAETDLLAQVHAVLVGRRRGHPDLILDSCSVRAKRGGDLTGPNPTDRAKRGTKYHVAVDGNGVPVACVASAANVNDTLVFERLFLAAYAIMARIWTVFADKGYDAEPHRDLYRFFGVTPQIYLRGQPPGSGLGQRRWPVERSNAWVLENNRLALRYDRLGFIIQSLLQAACIFAVAKRLARQF